MGDSWFRHDPPFKISPLTYPTVPQPVTVGPHPAWSLEKLKEYLALLKEVKELEDKLGCPCEPNKADYIKIIRERINALEAMG